MVTSDSQENRPFEQYCFVLQGLLKLSDSAKELLKKTAEFSKTNQLMKLVGSNEKTSVADPSLDLVRNLDARARERVRDHLEDAECLWLLARLVEYLLSNKHRPFCKHCFRTVTIRSNGRLKNFCREHASDAATGTASYQRGRKHQANLEAYLIKLPKLSKVRGGEELPLLDVLEWRLLNFQLNAFRKGGGNAGYVVTHMDGRGWILGSPLDFYELRLQEIADDYPDWSELALRWRSIFEDKEGVQTLRNGGVAVTPRLLVEQWLRWNAWKNKGDFAARVGKGRPAEFDHDEALRLRAKGMRVSEIAGEFPQINPKSLIVFFSRWDLAHIDREQAVRMRNEGMTDAQIAAHFSVSPKSVAKVLAIGEAVPE